VNPAKTAEPIKVFFLGGRQTCLGQRNHIRVAWKYTRMRRQLGQTQPGFLTGVQGWLKAVECLKVEPVEVGEPQPKFGSNIENSFFLSAFFQAKPVPC